VTVSFEADIGERDGTGGPVAGTEPQVGSDAGGSNRQQDSGPAVIAADGHGPDDVVYVDIRVDARDEDTDSLSDPTAEHPAAKLLSLIVIDAGGHVRVDGPPWAHLRVALPARTTRSEGAR
jgi:hypothetical protein